MGGPQAFAGVPDDIGAFCIVLKRYNPAFKNTPLDEVVSTINSIIWAYARSEHSYISTYGAVFTYFTNVIGERVVKLSISHTLLR
jgi:hypothetical protein